MHKSFLILINKINKKGKIVAPPIILNVPSELDKIDKDVSLKYLCQ